jgi:hypothetical protein
MTCSRWSEGRADGFKRRSLNSRCAASAALSRFPVRAQRRTLSSLGARAAPHASRPSARMAVQPPAPSRCARSAARLAPKRAHDSPSHLLPLGARAAPHASRPSARMAVQPPADRSVRAKRRTPRAGRAEGSPAACPELRRPESLGRQDHDLRLRLGPRELTAQARAICQRSAGGQPPPVATRPVNSREERSESVGQNNLSRPNVRTGRALKSAAHRYVHQ